MSRRCSLLHLLFAVSLSAALACGDDDMPADTTEDVTEDVPGDVPSDVDAPFEPPPINVRVGDDTRAACRDNNPLRQPFFGDLHVHTRFSFDAASYDVRTGPEEAYRFARGEAIGLPPYDESGQPTRMAQLRRPLDFAAVTDHAELIDAVSLCTDMGSPAYDSGTCVNYRSSSAITGFGPFISALTTRMPRRPPYCLENPEVCYGELADVWQRQIDAAENAYDKTENCEFTAFIGYEWTGSAGVGRNLHRNVIFAGATTLDRPVSFIEAPTPERLWNLLDATCLSNDSCDLLAIPHNGNIGSGEMFVPVMEDGQPYDENLSQLRARLEPLLEIYQHKGASECIEIAGDPLASEDELCGFEQFFERFCETPDQTDCTPLCDERSGAGFIGLGCAQPRDFARGALRTGLSEQTRIGVDPFRMGFIASTDTHSSTPGATEEDTWSGHTGNDDDEIEERFNPVGAINVTVRSASPGGLAVVWAEENSRESLFSSMRRRETYGTSGTRIVARFFGGWSSSFEPTLCDGTLVETGYQEGVPMGSELPARVGAGAPRFMVRALADAMSVPLERIQIIKGWVDARSGETFERVYEVAGGPSGASVDVNTCEPSGSGAMDLCGFWEDPDFDPAQPAFYYARIIENPSCRWSQFVCLSENIDCASVDPESNAAWCCNPEMPRTIQERAWTSPIWYTP